MIRLLSSLFPPSVPRLEWMIDLFAHLIYVLLRRTKSSEPPPAPPHAVRRVRPLCGREEPRGAPPALSEMREGGREGVMGSGFSVNEKTT